jgi:lipoprotein-anchoring transpeptidase ErfK/SrfK
VKKKIIILIVLIFLIIVLIILVRACQRPGAVIKTVSDKMAGNNISVSALFEQAKLAEVKDDLLKAKDCLGQILATAGDNKLLSQAQAKLYDVNIKIIFSHLETEQTKIYEVKAGDSLNNIAKQFDTTVALIKRSNNLSADVIRPAQRLRIWTGKFSCIVDKSQNLLTLKSGEEVVKVYRVSTGKQNSTPVGTFTITIKLKDPVWYKQGAVVLPNSPDNILGSRWLGFSLAGYGIHGTTSPETIGQQVTAGCVRMTNSEVEELFDLLPQGIEVTIID